MVARTIHWRWEGATVPLGITVDWPGFGDLPRPRVDWSPDALSAFLNWFLSEISPGSRMLVAAGHAATHALYLAVCRPDTIERLVLIAPTWRGPLPTVIGAYRPWFALYRYPAQVL
jgi:hypothetical protein